MSGFREHFLDKYFAYRRRYVDYILREAPGRASLAVLSEIARLSFMITGNAFCAAIFGVLSVNAFARIGLGVWPLVFGLLTAMPLLFALLSLRGLRDAISDRARVRVGAGAST